MFPAPKIANTGMWLRQLGAGFLLLTLLLSFNVSPAFAACTVGKDHSPVCKLIDPVNAMADNMSGVAFGMAGVGAIGLIVMSLLGRWPWGYFFAYIGAIAFLAIMPDFYAMVANYFKTDDATILFAKTEAFADETAVSLKQVLYGIGAFGAMGVAAVSFLSGRFRWGWMLAMLGGFTLTAQLADVVSVMTGLPANQFANPKISISDTKLPSIDYK